MGKVGVGERRRVMGRVEGERKKGGGGVCGRGGHLM